MSTIPTITWLMCSFTLFTLRQHLKVSLIIPSCNILTRLSPISRIRSRKGEHETTLRLFAQRLDACSAGQMEVGKETATLVYIGVPTPVSLSRIIMSHTRLKHSAGKMSPYLDLFLRMPPGQAGRVTMMRATTTSLLRTDRGRFCRFPP